MRFFNEPVEDLTNCNCARKNVLKSDKLGLQNISKKVHSIESVLFLDSNVRGVFAGFPDNVQKLVGWQCGGDVDRFCIQVNVQLIDFIFKQKACFSVYQKANTKEIKHLRVFVTVLPPSLPRTRSTAPEQPVHVISTLNSCTCELFNNFCYFLNAYEGQTNC